MDHFEDFSETQGPCRFVPDHLQRSALSITAGSDKGGSEIEQNVVKVDKADDKLALPNNQDEATQQQWQINDASLDSAGPDLSVNIEENGESDGIASSGKRDGEFATGSWAELLVSKSQDQDVSEKDFPPVLPADDMSGLRKAHLEFFTWLKRHAADE